MRAPLNCVYCGTEGAELRKKRMANGRFHVYWRCMGCGENALGNGRWVSQAGLDTDAIRWDTDDDPAQFRRVTQAGAQGALF